MRNPILTDAEMRALPDLLLARIQSILGDQLVGFYVVGSLVTGDFDFRSSDVDLIALLSTDLDDAGFQRLAQMHADLIRQQPAREDRIEVLYTSVGRLKGDRQDYQIAITSPGEPFHLRDVHHDDWTVNWYVLREKGIALLGPDPKTLVAPISQATLVAVVRAQSRATPEWLDSTASVRFQGYAILTLCRALRMVRTGDFVSKKQAAEWAAAQFPQWAGLIQKTLVWRVVELDPPEDPAAVFPETQRFMAFMLDRILSAA